ncbi:MAG: hypothetical protein KIT80_09400 [Chitinophagaceae bacterium]|nr:hypothetical protein [Chitinophagaceae bacterium]MCW5927114.1 hypothetical protein [Chitinophagaceae bacterium]
MDRHKQILMESLRFLTSENRIRIYGFVLIPNRPHLLRCKQDAWVSKNIQQVFLKYTAKQTKFNLIDSGNEQELEKYVSTQQDRSCHFWERRPYKATMHNRKTAEQTPDYMHLNPVKAGLCEFSADYKYSSEKYYELNEDNWGFITHYAEHI